MAYAGYNFIDTDIAVFGTEEEADEWVRNADPCIERRRYTDEEVSVLVGKNPKEEYDYIGIRWLIAQLSLGCLAQPYL